MLKKVILFVILSCLGANLFPQQNKDVWKWWRNNSPATDFFISLVSFNNILLAAGEGSKLYKVSSSSAEEFSDLNMGPQINIIDITYDPLNNHLLLLAADFITGKYYLFSVSSGGKSNLLTTFNEQHSSVAVSGNKVFLTGNKEIKNTDLPIQIDDQSIPSYSYTNIDGPDPTNSGNKFSEYFNDMTFLGNGTGIVVGNNSAFYYNNNPNDNSSVYQSGSFIGVAFEASKAAWNNSSSTLHKIAQNEPVFVIGNNFFTGTIGTGIVARSTDDGATYDSVFAVPNVILSAVSVGSNTNAIIGGNVFPGSKLYYTKDGGDTWTKGYDSPFNIRSISHISADSAYAVGDRGLALLTTDGGESWTQISDDHPVVSAIYFPSPSVGYATGASGPGFNILTVYKTIDAGDTWQATYVDSSFSASSVFFIDDMTGFIAGPKFIKTTDGGMIWNDVNTGVSSNPIFRDVQFVNNNLGFSVYGSGAIKTTNGGTTWNPLNMNTDFDKEFVYFADENLGFISGDSVLYRTTDGGDTWNKLSVGTNNENRNSKVTFINSTTGFFGKKGKVFKTTDRGDTWTDTAIDDHTIPRQIQFVIDSIGYFTATSDTFGIHTHVLFKTTDGGNSWVDLTNELPYAGISSLFFTDENTGYLAGRGILKTTSGGETITSVKEVDNASIPSGYKLYQNYPNPFNPTTKIKYSISAVKTQSDASLLITLKIYDILGREVTTLVNKQQQPGNYEVEFNGSKLASGVYFFRLQAGNFSATKKLVLLR